MNSCFTPADTTPVVTARGTGACQAVAGVLERTVRPGVGQHKLSENVENLFMVGAGTHPGAGIPGVLMSAKTREQVLPDVKAFA